MKRGGEVTLFSRHKKILNRRFPSVVEALASLGGDFVLDGELVAIDPQGRPSFQLLQNNLSRALPVYFYAFEFMPELGWRFGYFVVLGAIAVVCSGLWLGFKRSGWL